MRFMDGMTAAEKIRKVDSDVIIMFLTNRTDYAFGAIRSMRSIML